MFPVLFILLCLIVLMVVMEPMARPRRYEGDNELPPRNRAFDILNQCLARGEIDRSDYDEKQRTIAQGQ